MSKRVVRNSLALSALLFAGLAASAASGAPSAGPASPVIGAPKTTPRTATAGKQFTLSFRVTRGGALLRTGTMTAQVSLAGKALQHGELFNNGVARVAVVIPATAGGKLLRVRVTVKAATRSATRVASFRIARPASPTPTPSPAPPPPTTTTTEAPPPPPTPLAGMYCGFHDAGGGVCVEVSSDGMSIDAIQYGFEDLACSDGSHWRFFTGNIPVFIPLVDGHFSGSRHFDRFANGDAADGNLQIDGSVDTAGNAKGTIHYTVTFGGRSCDSELRSWTAQLGR